MRGGITPEGHGPLVRGMPPPSPIPPPGPKGDSARERVRKPSPVPPDIGERRNDPLADYPSALQPGLEPGWPPPPHPAGPAPPERAAVGYDHGAAASHVGAGVARHCPEAPQWAGGPVCLGEGRGGPDRRPPPDDQDARQECPRPGPH